MRTPITLCVLCAALTGAWAATPEALPSPAFPTFERPAQITAACDRGLAAAAARVRALEQRPGDARWSAAFDDLAVQIEDASGPIYVLTTVHPDKAMRRAAEACELRWRAFVTVLNQNGRLYRAARSVKPRDDIEHEFMKTTLESFEDAGAGLRPPERRRAKTLQARIDGLEQAFERAVRDSPVRVTFTEAELAGVPPTMTRDAKRDEQGRITITLDDASYPLLMRTATGAAVRERVWRAETQRGGAGNLKRLGELAKLRLEYARLFGAKTYAEFVLRRRMAQSPERARAFLDDVNQAVAERERTELAEIAQAKAKALGQLPAEVKIERWDATFYGEQVRRERHALDQEVFREHLPAQPSLLLAMRMVEKLLGVKYTCVEGAKLWHPQVQSWVVSDAASSKPLATLYVDLFPREGKGDGAFVWGYRSGSTRLGRLPAAVLVTNLDRRGLTLEDFGQTLLHEFGHAVHNNLSATRFASQAGTSVLRDFVEAPSQMLEDWIYDRDVLALMREVCADCKPVPDSLLVQARAAERFGIGTRYARQALYAAYDLALYGADAREPLALWEQLEARTPLGYVPGSMLPASFGHVAGGYAAGYYGYLWSEVVAADLRTAFARDKLDAAVGRRYRESVLANGGQKPPQQLVQEFLGRPFDSRAFFEELKR